MPDLITCISIPRSGTNFILLNLLSKIKKFNVNLEIFHQSPEIRKISIFHKDCNKNFENDKPIDIINHLLECNENEFVIHKIFPFMFDDNDNNLNEIIDKSKYIFFIKRNYLDNYISLKKTLITGSYSKFDTSNIKINFDIEEFEQFKQINETWYKKTLNICHELNKKNFFLDYDEIMKLNDNERLNHCLNKFNDMLETKLILNEINDFEGLIKQDKTIKYEDKIENYEKVKDFINKKIWIKNMNIIEEIKKRNLKPIGLIHVGAHTCLEYKFI